MTGSVCTTALHFTPGHGRAEGRSSGIKKRPERFSLRPVTGIGCPDTGQFIQAIFSSTYFLIDPYISFNIILLESIL